MTGPGLPVVFLGPTLPHAEASAILAADYRPPVRRGDLEGFAAGAVVAIIDGVFDQALAVSPSEVRAAVARGVQVFGASSMGALRAAEVPGVIGVGRIYEMYRRGTLDKDDEVAVVFDPETLRPYSVPLVNVRHALDRLTRPGTIPRALAASVLRAARKLPYWERDYRRILAAAGLDGRPEAAQLAGMLASHDLKRDDAVTLLERLRGVAPGPVRRARRRGRTPRAVVAPAAAPVAGGAVHLWEFGPPLPFRDLIVFLAASGALPAVARAALARLGPAPGPGAGPGGERVRARLLARTARAWSWGTEEEVDVSLADLGIDHAALEAGLAAQVAAERRAMSLLRARDPAFLEALRLELFLDDLALKREAARAGSLAWLAGRAGGGEPARDERAAALGRVCQAIDASDERAARAWLGAWGLTAAEIDGHVDRLARARRVPPSPRGRPVPRRLPLVEPRCPKAPGSRRFCVPLGRALPISRRLAAAVGITRIAMITELGTLGIPNAQAFRPDGEWSSTVGSGKSETAAGARVGAVMEEVEKWAQEQYSRAPAPRDQVIASHDALCARGRAGDVVDPRTLDLPYDSCYRPDLAIAWRRCEDLIGGRRVWIPVAALVHRRIADDIYFSPHGGRKTVTTNGLASGLTMAEAVTHALCEVIERHARTVAAIVDGNPGAPGQPPRRRVELASAPRSTRRLAGKIAAAGHRLVVCELTGEIRVPTFSATILLHDPAGEGQLFGDGWRRASGWACHPDPGVAIEMAILEASQTVMTHIAGAREDLTLAARSLGRHERSDAIRHAAHHAELDAAAPRVDAAALAGLTSGDASADVRWIVERLRDAGCAHAVIADYSDDRIRPARVVRAVLPGLDTINPFHTGEVPRRALLRDLL